MVKVALMHMGYIIALMVFSLTSSLVIFGAGFGGGIDVPALFIPFVFSVVWVGVYIRHIISRKPDKKKLVHPTKNWTFLSLFLSGLFTVYGLLLTWLIPVAFLLSIILLLFWYALLFALTKSNSSLPQSIYGSILFLVALTFVYQILKYLITI